MKNKFYCPDCQTPFYFDDILTGEQAKCLACEKKLIRCEDNQNQQEVDTAIEDDLPIPGFYRGVFLESFKIFTKSASLTGLVFVIAAVCFKFFVGHVDYSFDTPGIRFQAPLGQLTTIAAWGCIFWYCMEIISSTAFDIDELPEPDMGGFFGFIWNIIKSIFIFAVALFIVELPYIISIVVSDKLDINFSVIHKILAMCGLFFFPSVILTVSVGGDVLMMVRPSHVLMPIIHIFKPYMVTAGLFLLACYLQMKTVGYGQISESSAIVIGLHLLANLAVMILILIAVRSIALLYRHHSCYFPY